MNWEKVRRLKLFEIRNEKGDITTNSTEMKKIKREYYEHLCNKLDNPGEM